MHISKVKFPNQEKGKERKSVKTKERRKAVGGGTRGGQR